MAIVRYSQEIRTAFSGLRLWRAPRRRVSGGAESPQVATTRARGSLWRPAAFTLVVGVTSYSAAGVWREEQRNKWLRRYRRNWNSQERTGLLGKVQQWWGSLQVADRFCLTLVAVNTGVFVMWRVRGFQPVMEKYFLSQISNRSTLPLLLSEFSHVEVWHLALNMLVLWSFAPSLLRTLGDPVSLNLVWPYYLTGGVFASMIGFYAKLLRGSPLGSLGASGALMAVVTLVVMNNPNTSLYIIFLPFIPIPAYMALAGVVTMDVIGVLRGWQFFDHAGHLGGVIFAVLYQWWLGKKAVEWQLKVGRLWRRIKSRTGPRDA